VQHHGDGHRQHEVDPHVPVEARPAYEYTRVHCHSSHSCVLHIGILHINENVGGIMTESPRRSRPKLWIRLIAVLSHSTCTNQKNALLCVVPYLGAFT
jgi:hypothetical protein